MTTTARAPLHTPIGTRLASVALATLLTLATLSGVNALAVSDVAAPLLAQGTGTQA